MLRAPEDDAEGPSDDKRFLYHFEGRLIDGMVFDSSYKRSHPMAWNAREPIAILGLQEAMQLMRVGGKTEFYLPSEIGLQDREIGGRIKSGSVLIYVIEVLKTIPYIPAKEEL